MIPTIKVANPVSIVIVISLEIGNPKNLIGLY